MKRIVRLPLFVCLLLSCSLALGVGNAAGGWWKTAPSLGSIHKKRTFQAAVVKLYVGLPMKKGSSYAYTAKKYGWDKASLEITLLVRDTLGRRFKVDSSKTYLKSFRSAEGFDLLPHCLPKKGLSIVRPAHVKSTSAAREALLMFRCKPVLRGSAPWKLRVHVAAEIPTGTTRLTSLKAYDFSQKKGSLSFPGSSVKVNRRGYMRFGSKYTARFQFSTAGWTKRVALLGSGGKPNFYNWNSDTQTLKLFSRSVKAKVRITFFQSKPFAQEIPLRVQLQLRPLPELAARAMACSFKYPPACRWLRRCNSFTTLRPSTRSLQACQRLVEAEKAGAIKLSSQQKNLFKRRACKFGLGKACRELALSPFRFFGRLYLRNKPKRRYLKALRLLRKGCKYGDGGSCRFVGLFFEKGYGVPRNCATSNRFYQRACENNDRLGCARKCGKVETKKVKILVRVSGIVTSRRKTAAGFTDKIVTVNLTPLQVLKGKVNVLGLSYRTSNPRWVRVFSKLRVRDIAGMTCTFGSGSLGAPRLRFYTRSVFRQRTSGCRLRVLRKLPVRLVRKARVKVSSKMRMKSGSSYTLDLTFRKTGDLVGRLPGAVFKAELKGMHWYRRYKEIPTSNIVTIVYIKAPRVGFPGSLSIDGKSSRYVLIDFQ